MQCKKGHLRESIRYASITLPSASESKYGHHHGERRTRTRQIVAARCSETRHIDGVENGQFSKDDLHQTALQVNYQYIDYDVEKLQMVV